VNSTKIEMAVTNGSHIDQALVRQSKLKNQSAPIVRNGRQRRKKINSKGME